MPETAPTATRLFNRAVIRIAPTEDGRAEGENAAAFLQGLVTNDVSPIATGAPVYAALLSAQGKAMFDFLVWPDHITGDAAALLIDAEAEFADELVKRLSLYRLRRKLVIARDDSLGVFWSAEGAAGAHDAPDPRLDTLGRRAVAPASGTESAGDAAWQAHRLGQGVPEGRAELGDILWLETNAVELNGVSFTKGCYIGQENTARMNWRQKVNRRLVVVPLAASAEARRKTAYPDLGLAIDHLRTEAIDAAHVPGWLQSALMPEESEDAQPGG
ncbi:folate-binding protein [Altererythrobacter xixiisoli]|uniref:Folate-binding protein n=1 Tax=Croceibacterium xixiisoli TaxID=1476466 RepID=A0A6I4TY18_9SPHN|nr:folate-binding protein YgfZ [Croceibacterium xixiisoli]MXO99677.1 folate-binding protein [Croceibacterium xixiisoli]